MRVRIWNGHSYRVGRGGSWCNFAQVCRAANRFNDAPGFRINSLGLRLVRGVK